MSQAQDSVSSNLTLGTNLNAVIAQLWQRKYIEYVYSAGSNPAHGTILFIAALHAAIKSLLQENFRNTWRGGLNEVTLGVLTRNPIWFCHLLRLFP